MTIAATARTLREAATAYAAIAFADLYEGPTSQVVEPFADLKEYVDFEFSGDAHAEAHRLSKEFGIAWEDAADALREALTEVDLDRINGAIEAA